MGVIVRFDSPVTRRSTGTVFNTYIRLKLLQKSLKLSVLIENIINRVKNYADDVTAQYK